MRRLHERMRESSQPSPADFDDLYLHSFDDVARAVFTVVGRREEAFDITQEAFVRTWAKWDQVRHYDNPELFTLRVARNLSMSHLRRVIRFRLLYPRVASRSLEPDLGRQADLRLTLMAEMRKLPLRQRWAVALSDVLNLATKEGAATLGIRESTFRVHLARGRAALRASLAVDDQAGADLLDTHEDG